MENPDGHPAANSGVSTDVNQNGNNQQMNNERSALTRSNREERLKLLKERQNEERLKKLEELKLNALQAAKIREEQDARRRKHFEEFGKKEDERRRQAEERRRHLDEERKVTLQTKWATKKFSLVRAPERAKPIFAFGSCTPRLVDNLVDGCLWKSQYNLHSTKEPPVKSTTSAQDLHSQIKMSRSMYEWNQQRTTFDLNLPPGGMKYRKSRTMELDPDRVFCGRKRTDLTPTLPTRREDGSSPRSTSRAGTNSGPRSGNATPSSRPPSSMSSLMTSSAHSQVHVQMRPRTLNSRKSRPISVHVTGVSSADTTPPLSKTEKPLLQPRPPNIMKTNSATGTLKAEKSKNDIPTPPSPAKTLPRKKVESEAKPKKVDETTKSKSAAEGKSDVSKKTEKPQIDTSTIKRAKSAPKKKEMIEKPVDKESEMGDVPGHEIEKKEVLENTSKSTEKEVTSPPLADQKIENEIVKLPDDLDQMNHSIGPLEQQVEIETFEQEPEFVSFVEVKASIGEKIEEDVTVDKMAVNLDFPKSGANEIHLIESSPSPLAKPQPIDTVVNGMNGTIDNHRKEMSTGWNPFSEEIVSPDGATVENTFEGKPKLMTEEDAKAALADKRRLAREAQEREAARLEEEERLEEEREQLEGEEADRMALVAREMEEERLRVAIEEQKQRELGEKKKREEEEMARQERERDEREAAREAERIRQEMEERLKREEEERLERKRRVEAIMSRTRKTGPDSAKATTPIPEENPPPVEGIFSVNGIQHALDDVTSTPRAINNLNNYNNNNDFSNTLIDFGDISSTATAATQQTNNSTTNLINTSLQDLLS